MNTVFTSQRMAAGTVGPRMVILFMVKTRPNSLIRQPPKDSSNRGAERLLIRFSKLVITHSVGNQTGSVAMMAFLVLNAPVMIQYRGKVNRNARTRMTTKEKM